MSAKVSIVDTTTDIEVSVTPDHRLKSSSAPFYELEPRGVSSRMTFLSGYLGTTGFDSGTTNANVNGATTTQKFYIQAAKDYDIRIMKLMIYIQDSAVTHHGFGALASLTNGIDIVAIESGVETYIIKAAKNFAQLIEQTCAERSFGDAATSFELTDVTTGNEDAQVLPFDISSIMPFGLRIGRGTFDKIELRVKDNLTGLTTFTVRALGYKQVE